MSTRLTDTRKLFQFSRFKSLSNARVVGLSVDATQWVKAGLITHHEMIVRNWAYIATLFQVVAVLVIIYKADADSEC